MPSQAIYLTVVIPVYNEEKRIQKTLKTLQRFLSYQKFSWELIIVDDGSSDQTVRKVGNLMEKNTNERVITNNVNRGKGYVVHQGVMEASGRYILFMDADSATPIDELEKLLPHIKNFPVVVGSRYVAGSNIVRRQPWGRIVLSRFSNWLIRMVLNLSLKDTQCGFKLFEKKAARMIFSRQTIWRWGFDIEILAIAEHLGYKIKEVGVSWYDHPASKLRAGRAVFQTLLELLTIKKNIILKRYG